MTAVDCSKIVLLIALALLSGGAQAQVDLAGEWRGLRHEDQPERGPGPEIGDFTGLPLNEAGMRRGLSWDASLLTVPEHQCSPHPANYGVMHGNVRIWKEVDQESQNVVAWHILHESYGRFRVVWMDGRTRPSADARHSWQGFSTGHFEAGVLVVETTHLKAGWIRRNGLPLSDRATMTDRFHRYGDIMTHVMMIEDPVYLTEPLVKTNGFRLSPAGTMAPYPCEPVVELVREPGSVPSHLPGENPFLQEFSERHDIPFEAARGGAETALPEYEARLERLR